MQRLPMISEMAPREFLRLVIWVLGNQMFIQQELALEDLPMIRMRGGRTRLPVISDMGSKELPMKREIHVNVLVAYDQ